VVRCLFIELTPKLISKITTLPLGVPWRKEDKGDIQTAKKKFFLEGEEPIEDKNGVRRKSLPYPWNEVSYHLIKYISREGRYSVVYGYHFRLLEELSFETERPPHHRLNIPYFLLIDRYKHKGVGRKLPIVSPSWVNYNHHRRCPPKPQNSYPMGNFQRHEDI